MMDRLSHGQVNYTFFSSGTPAKVFVSQYQTDYNEHIPDDSADETASVLSSTR
jgi:hypothetical protein